MTSEADHPVQVSARRPWSAPREAADGLSGSPRASGLDNRFGFSRADSRLFAPASALCLRLGLPRFWRGIRGADGGSLSHVHEGGRVFVGVQIT